MKKIKYTFILCMLLFCNLIYASAPVYTENQTNITVTAEQPQFIIQLKSNRSTGYSWFLRQYDARLVKVIEHKYISSTSRLLGAPGVERWSFKLTAEGLAMLAKTKIHFTYARPWEQKKPARQLVFNVHMH